jgi:hypothetical protein
MLVTVVTPIGKALPLAGTVVTFVTLQLSVAVTVKVTLLREQAPSSAVKTRSVGQVMTGAVPSTTVTVWLH